MYQNRFLGIWWTATPYEIKREEQVNSQISSRGPYFNRSTPINDVVNLPNVIPGAFGMPVNFIQVKVIGKKTPTSTVKTCTCSS